MRREKVELSERALVARIGRALKKQHQKLLRCRASSPSHNDLGDYYVVDRAINGVVRKDVDLEEISAELEVLQPWETLAKE